jgi:two-component system nitrate/nitrite sensor histidine kinase NarX
MHHRGQVLGVYSLFFDGGVEPGDEVMSLLKSIGDLLGLALYNAQLERRHVEAIAVAERHAMAADLHDSIGQSLAFVKMRLPLLQDAIRGCDQTVAQRYFDDVRAAVAQAHTSLRGILTLARTPMDPLGLSHALEGSVQAFRRSAGVSLDYVNEAGALRLDAQREAQVFHVVQEALANVARHARARRAWLRVTARADDRLRIVVEDDGAGLPAEDTAADGGAGSHYGLSIMRERARRLGGTLFIGAREGGGTRVQLDVPMQAGAAQEVA